MGTRGVVRVPGVVACAGVVGFVALTLAFAVGVAGGVAGMQVRFALILLSIVGTAVGIARNHPPRRRPWLLLLGGMTASATGDVAVLVAMAEGPVTAHVPLDAWLTVAAGLLFLAALLDATRPIGRGDVGSALDALIATLAAGSVVWQLIVVPAAAPGWAGSGTELAGALQVAVLLAVLVLLGRVAVAIPAKDRLAATLLTLGVLAALVAFLTGALRDAAGGNAYSGARAGLGALANLTAAGAALHPSMRVLTQPRAASVDRVSLGRTLLLGLALVTPPALLTVATLRGTEVALVSLSVAWVALAVAVLARVHLLHRSRDVARDELARSEDRLISLVANTLDTVLLVATPPGGPPQVRFASGGCRRLTGLEPEALCRLPLETIAEAGDGHTLLTLIAGDAPLPRTGDLRVGHTDGTHRWVEVVVDEAPQEEERSAVVTLRDVDERKRAELALAEVALRDELTGLWNRRGLFALLGAALAAPVEDGMSTAVILGDLDGFKAVNDGAGHASGDAVLRALAHRLQAAVRDRDVVGRLGGDEFLVLCNVDGPDTVRAIADRIVAVGREPFHVDGTAHEVGISVGVALGAAGSEVDDLLRRADVALYEAKVAGKGRVHFAQGG